MTVIVDSLEIRIVSMRLAHPFKTSFGEETERETVLVKISAGADQGWGEAPVARLPGYSYETSGTAFHVLRDFFAPRLTGIEVDSTDRLRSLLAGLKGHPMARCGLEAALTDLLSRLRGIPLAKAYGGTAESIDVGVSIGIQPSPEALLKRIERFTSRGYRRVKLKIMPGWDLEVLARVRKAFPNLRLWADANQAYARKDLDRFRAIDDYGLELLEQPLHQDDLAGHAAWAAALETPLCLDESVSTVEGLNNAIELKALGVLNVKPARVGGFSTAMAMEKTCAAAGIRCWIGGLLETGIGRAHNVAIASRPGFELPGDISASDRYFARDLVHPAFALRPDGRIDVPEGPGLGCDVDTDMVEERTLRVAVVRV